METKHPLFNGELREKMENEVKSFTAEPAPIVARLEDTICSYLILAARRIGGQLAQKAYDKISKP